MMKHPISIVSVAIAAIFCPAWMSARSMQLHISSGELASHSVSIKETAPDALILSGSADVRDLRFIADSLPSSVNEIDLSQLTLLSYTFPLDSEEPRAVYREGIIPSGTFAFSRFVRFSLPNNTWELGEAAFAGAKISEITLTHNLKTIGDYAFAGCADLAIVTASYPALTIIGKGAFENCHKLKTIDISSTWTETISERAFALCSSLSDIKFPSTLRKVGSEAFAGTAISELDLHFEIRTDNFALSSMSSLERASVDWAPLSCGMFFNNPRLTSIEKAGGDLPALFAAATAVTDPSTFLYAESLGEYALESIPIDSLKLGSKLYHIGTGAFSRMRSLRTIDVTELNDNIPDTETDAFDGIIPSDIILWVNEKFSDIWKQDQQWSRFNIKGRKVSGVEEITTDVLSPIQFEVSGTELRISSGGTLQTVRIFSLDGTILAAASPGTTVWKCDIASWRGSVVTALATDADGNKKVFKFIVE